MSIMQFIRENREEIDREIQKIAPDARKNDRERELWVMNDSNLYYWWKSL